MHFILQVFFSTQTPNCTLKPLRFTLHSTQTPDCALEPRRCTLYTTQTPECTLKPCSCTFCSRFTAAMSQDMCSLTLLNNMHSLHIVMGYSLIIIYVYNRGSNLESVYLLTYWKFSPCSQALRKQVPCSHNLKPDLAMLQRLWEFPNLLSHLYRIGKSCLNNKLKCMNCIQHYVHTHIYIITVAYLIKWSTMHNI